MKNTQEINNILNKAHCIVSNAEIESALDKMALEIDALVGQDNPIVMCVLLGGLVPMGNLLTRLKFPLELDYVHVTRFHGTTTASSKLTWIAQPSRDLTNRTVLLVDDILDKGITLAQIVKHCKSLGAKTVKTAVMTDKKCTRSEEGIQKADVVGIEVEDKFIFGYGLDYEEYHRNLDGIYVVD